jgi:hypothetical protein
MHVNWLSSHASASPEFSNVSCLNFLDSLMNHSHDR